MVTATKLGLRLPNCAKCGTGVRIAWWRCCQKHRTPEWHFGSSALQTVSAITQLNSPLPHLPHQNSPANDARLYPALSIVIEAEQRPARVAITRVLLALAIARTDCLLAHRRIVLAAIPARALLMLDHLHYDLIDHVRIVIQLRVLQAPADYGARRAGQRLPTARRQANRPRIRRKLDATRQAHQRNIIDMAAAQIAAIQRMSEHNIGSSNRSIRRIGVAPMIARLHDHLLPGARRVAVFGQHLCGPSGDVLLRRHAH